MPAPAASVPLGFQDSVVFSGLTNPTAIRFATDGRVFVAEKSGLLKVFDSLANSTPTTVVDLRDQVDDYWDRGLLGMALDPNFPATPYVYLLYTYDAPPGQTAPVWNDGCPTPPGPTSDGCVVTGKLVRIQVAADDHEVGTPQVLIADQWCQQYPSHSVGDLGFGPDGKLYVSGGEGASFTGVDYGQNGGALTGTTTPKNPCGDPPAGVGGTEAAPAAEGGALRAQSPRRVHGPALLNGALLRLDPATGAAAADNPNAASADLNLRRIVAYGFRNPFRFAFRPGSSQLWLGDVGWDSWEEIERIATPATSVLDFGWPCFEGPAPQPAYQSAGLSLCSNLSASSVTGAYFNYSHTDEVSLDDGCPTTQGSVVSGIGFYGGTSYPSAYRGALFFADHSRECIWEMPLGANGEPDPTRVQPFVNEAANPVDIQSGPNGDLYYVDFDGGTIHHLSYGATGVCAAGTFLAEYRNNTDLSGAPVLSRCESAINHAWAGNRPGPGVNADNFSARWTGQFAFAGGTYAFSSTTDDGVRLYVDGSLLIDGWQDGPVTRTASKSLAPGTHPGELAARRAERCSDTGDRHAVALADLRRRRCDLVLGPCQRHGGRGAAGLGALLDAADPPLHDPDHVPRPQRADLERGLERQPQRSRPRLPVTPQASPPSDRQRRARELDERDPRTEDRRPLIRDDPHRPGTRGREQQRRDALHAHGDRRLGELRQRTRDADARRAHLRVRLVVGWRRGDAHRDRALERRRLHGHLQRRDAATAAATTTTTAAAATAASVPPTGAAAALDAGADAEWHRGRGPAPHRPRGQLERRVTDPLLVPVAALQPPRERLRGGGGRDQRDVPARRRGGRRSDGGAGDGGERGGVGHHADGSVGDRREVPPSADQRAQVRSVLPRVGVAAQAAATPALASRASGRAPCGGSVRTASDPEGSSAKYCLSGARCARPGN